MANEKVVIKQGLTGGTSADLDSISYTAMVTDNVALVEDGSRSYTYVYDATSSAAESSPGVIKPDDAGANPGRWLLRPDYSLNNINLLLNPAFLVNQDAYTFGAAAAANTYLLDGWFTDSSSGKITDNLDGTFTVTDLLQPVDDTDMDGDTVTISATVTGAGSLSVYTVGIGSKSDIDTPSLIGVIDASTSRLTFNLAAGVKAYPGIKISGAAKFKHLKLETGSSNTSYVKKSFIDELDSCQTQFWKTYEYATAPGTVTNKGRLIMYPPAIGTNKAFFCVTPPRAMRVDPSITIYSTNDGSTGYFYNTGDAANIAATASKNENSINLGNSGAIGTAGLISCHVTVDARI